MLETLPDNPTPAPLSPVLLLTGNQVLALDIQQALQSIGLTTRVYGTDDIGELTEVEPENVSAAIIDLEEGDTRWPSCLSWLDRFNIRTIVVSCDEDLLEDAERRNRRFPNVIARFDMPFNVDDMLPILRMPAGACSAKTDALPG